MVAIASPFRRFSTAALRCVDGEELCGTFAEACAALGVTRYHAFQRTAGRTVVLASTYPFDPERVQELGAHQWAWAMADGTEVVVRLAAVSPLAEPARAQLAGAAMLFATRLWQLRCARDVAPTQQPDRFARKSPTWIRLTPP